MVVRQQEGGKFCCVIRKPPGRRKLIFDLRTKHSLFIAQFLLKDHSSNNSTFHCVEASNAHNLVFEFRDDEWNLFDCNELPSGRRSLLITRYVPGLQFLCQLPFILHFMEIELCEIGPSN